MKRTNIVRSIAFEVHKWLGLLTGLVVFTVCITGSLYVFRSEIEGLLEPWRTVKSQSQPFVLPKVLLDTAKTYMPHREATGLTYAHATGAAAVGFMHRENNRTSFSVVYMNPYTGKHLKTVEQKGDTEFDFFSFILQGHTRLWLPPNIGKPVVGWSVFIFFVTLITGFILWWPLKWNKKSIKRSFTFKRKPKRKRFILDLHQVAGFYALFFALIITITGLVWSFEWFAKGYYYVVSGGQAKTNEARAALPLSEPDTMTLKLDFEVALNKVWHRTVAENPNFEGAFLNLNPKNETDPIMVLTYQQKGRYYDRNTYYYDRITLQPIRVPGDRFQEASLADKLVMMNYDLHTGSILGFPGKVLAFLVSLLCASFPITGFLLWMNKKRSEKNEHHK